MSTYDNDIAQQSWDTNLRTPCIYSLLWILFKYASKKYSKEVGVTGTGDITTVSANGDEASKGQKVKNNFGILVTLVNIIKCLT